MFIFEGYKLLETSLSPRALLLSLLPRFSTSTSSSMDVENKAALGGDGEKSSPSVTSVESYLDVRESDKVQRKLRQRHVQM